MLLNKTLWIYFAISLIGHVVIALILFILMALPLIGAMGNSPSPWILTSGVLFIIGLLILVLFHAYLYSRKSLTFLQKLIVSLGPLILGILVFLNIPTITSYTMRNNRSNEIARAINAITFAESFSLANTNTKLENGSIIKHTIIIPFELKKDTDINDIIFAYYVGIDGLTLNVSDPKQSVECPMDNDIFSGIKDSQGNVHDIKDYSHGIILPRGKYEAIKYVDVNSSANHEDVCYEKIINEIRVEKKIEIYEANLHNDADTSKMIAAPNLNED